MLTSIEEARDEILTHFKTAWDTAVFGKDYEDMPIFYDDVAGDTPPNTPWIRIRVQHNSGSQRSMGEEGNRKFTRFGILTIQLFTPFGDGSGVSDEISQILIDIFEGRKTAPDDVWFRSVRYREVGQDKAWWQTNITVDFRYEVMK
jgi:hypothetical protein